MKKLKDLLNENSFSLVGGVVSSPGWWWNKHRSY